MYTALPVDFDEPISLVYSKLAYNVGGQAGWQWNQYTRLLQNTGNGASGNNGGYSTGPYTGLLGQKWYSSTNINGSKQLIQIGSNIIQGNVVNAFNNLNLLSTTGDATTPAVDNNVFVNGGGSVSFTINPLLGHGYGGIKISGFGIMSVQTALQNAAINKVYSWLPTTAISHIDLIMTSATGTYTFTATAQDSGMPFIQSTLNSVWNRTQYPWSSVSISGTPNSQEITSYEFRYYEGAGFGSVAIPFFRIDDYYLSYPDSMNLIYYSQYKGTDSTGTTQKIILDSTTDLPNFMQFYPDFINMIALRAAYILAPQLALDKDFMEIYKSDYKDSLADYGKIYPRKRSVNLGVTFLRRP